MERQIAILAVVAVLAAPAVAVTVQQQAQADMRLCMQRAAAALDDQASDVRIVARFVLGRCMNEAQTLFDLSAGDGLPEAILGTATAIVLEHRAPRWWQFWK